MPLWRINFTNPIKDLNMTTKKNQATSQNETIKKVAKRIGKRKGNRSMKYSIAMFLATGGMPWMV